MSTLYASFVDVSAAERAAGALLDHGARHEDISLLANERGLTGRSTVSTPEAAHAEHAAKTGISTTTPADVAAGTVKGTAIGIGVGALAALASLFIPGIGLVVGGGAIATALMGAAGTALAGAAAGSVAGLLRDQGVPEEMVTRFSTAFEEGGAILAIAVPTGSLDAGEAEALLAKYGATNVATYNAPRILAEGVETPQGAPVVVNNANPDIGPVMIVDRAATPMVGAAPVAGAVPMQTVIDPVTGVAVQRPIGAAGVPVQPTVAAQPVIPATVATPPVSQVVVDPVTGAQTAVPATPVGVPTTAVPVEQVTTMPANQEVVTDPYGQLHQTVGHPTVVSETPVVVTDPATGQARPATVVEEQRAVVAEPTMVDANGNVVQGPVDAAGETVVVRDKRIELH